MEANTGENEHHTREEPMRARSHVLQQGARVRACVRARVCTYDSVHACVIVDTPPTSTGERRWCDGDLRNGRQITRE